MQTPALIFDCDGTLVDSLGDALSSFNYALEQVGERPRTIDEIKRYFGAAADRILLSVIGDAEKAKRAFEFYFDHQSELALNMKLFPGIMELLENAKRAGVPMAIVTGRHERDLEVVLRPHNIREYFQTLIADSQLPHSKPAPDGILLAASRLGVDPARSIYVGDSPSDMEAAERAGAIGAAALWDKLSSREAMQPFHPQVMARTPADLWQFWQAHKST